MVNGNATNAPTDVVPGVIETPQGQVVVAGANENASHATYETPAAAAHALARAQDACIAACKRWGLQGLVVVAARHGDDAATSLSAVVHGDTQFIGTAMAQLQGMNGWKEAAALEADAGRYDGEGEG